MGSPKNYERVFKMPFSDIYPHYVTKIERKGRTVAELDAVLTWLTGYNDTQLSGLKTDDTSLSDFFANAPQLHPNTALIKGVICGYRVEEIEDPLMQKIRWMDKVVDELAKGKALPKIFRES